MGTSATTTGNSFTVTGLENGMFYSFTLTATSNVGTSPSSVATGNVAPATTPNAPTNVSSVVGNEGAIVSWDASSSDGGSSILHYTVMSTPGSITATTTQTTLSVPGLTNGVAYTFKVSATNSVGTGPESAASNPVTPAALPDAPTGIIATSGDKQANVSWTEPSNNGSAITVYTVSIIPTGSIATTTSTSVLIQNLTNGTEYRFQVIASNNVGDSQPSSISNAVTPKPTSFTVYTAERSFFEEGQSSTYEMATFDTLSATSTHTAVITWGDGLSSTGEVVLSGLEGSVGGTHIYEENGTYSVTVTVTVNNTEQASDIGVVDVSNADPVVTMESFEKATLDSFGTPRATFTDQGSQDTHTAEIDWGDGATSTLVIDNSDDSVGGNHQYSYPGSYIVTLSVTDDDGGVGIATTSLLVAQPNAVVSIPSMTLVAMCLSAITMVVMSFWLFRRRTRV